MSALIYFICYPWLYLLSLLPFSTLYLISDCFYFFIYYILGYRKKVVIQNLKNAFPNKTEEEIKSLSKKFYRFFCDMIFETVKIISLSRKQLHEHVSFDGTEVFKKQLDKKQSVIAVMGHMGNWELAGARFSSEPVHQLYVIYHPIKNKYFDNMFCKIRTRFGNKLYSRNDAYKKMIENKAQFTATVFLADQTPYPVTAYWTTFLNQDTPVFNGTAKIARKLNYPVIYISVKRPKRGQYTVSGEMLIENPKDFSEEEISEIHTKRLEKDILENPEIWLWSHKRWKHKKPNA